MAAPSIRPVKQYQPTDWLESLPYFSQSEQADQQLDLARLVVDSNAYYMQGRGFPIPQDGDFASNPGILQVVGSCLGPSATVSGSLQVPPYSYCVAINLTCFNPNNIGAAVPGFSFRVFDKGTKADIFPKSNSKMWVFSNNVASTEIGVIGGAQQPMLLQEPLMVYPPGVWQVDVANLDSVNPALVQIFFMFACPRTNQNQGKAVQKPIEVKQDTHNV